MPFIDPIQRKVVLDHLKDGDVFEWLLALPVTHRKGYVAFLVNWLGKHCFTDNYFGKSTGTDAVRSAYKEMKKELEEYEAEKKRNNGEV